MAKDKFRNLELVQNEPVKVVPEVRPFDLPPLKKKGAGTYGEVKAKFGPLAATDPDRAAKSKKDSQFTLNPLLRQALSVEQEERRVIEEKVRAQVDSLRDQVLEEARKEGYAAGLRKGFEESSQRMQVQAVDTIKKFEKFLNDLDNAKVDIFQANERFLIELVFRIARKILLKELSVDKDYILRLARELVNQVGARDKITLRISPDDMQRIEDLRMDLVEKFHELKNLTIEASSQIPEGGMRVETDWNSIDTDVNSQIDRLYQALLGQGEENSV